MARWIDAKKTDDGIRYREWCSVVDVYLTPLLTRGEMLAHLDDAGAEARLDRADRLGCSLVNRIRRSLDDPWSAERCDGCGGFHHTFVASVRAPECGECGEPESERSHGPACGGES